MHQQDFQVVLPALGTGLTLPSPREPPMGEARVPCLDLAQREAVKVISALFATTASLPFYI